MTQPTILYRKAIPADFEGILVLQHHNLVTNLTGEDLSQGYLSIDFTREQLHKISSELGIFVAVQGKAVVGYLMAGTAEFAVGSPLLSNMLKRLKDVVFDGVALSCCFFVYGPVCVEKQSRGQGILEGLFGIMKEALKAGYDVGVAFVSQGNKRSLQAHKTKLGMKVIDEFEFDGERYYTLAFRVK